MPCEFTVALGMSRMTRSYSELVKLGSFEERFRYLQLDGVVGHETFGYDRYFNQAFYRSSEWKQIRDRVILRDNGCDLGVPGYEIHGKIYIHHINPIELRDIEVQSDLLLNPEYLICTTHRTHNAIHYGDEDQLISKPTERTKNDTCPWRNS